MMNQDKPTVLLEYHLKQLKLPSMLREYASLAAVCSKQRSDYPGGQRAELPVQRVQAKVTGPS